MNENVPVEATRILPLAEYSSSLSLYWDRLHAETSWNLLSLLWYLEAEEKQNGKESTNTNYCYHWQLTHLDKLQLCRIQVQMFATSHLNWNKLTLGVGLLFNMLC